MCFIWAIKKCSRCTTRSSTSFKVAAAGGGVDSLLCAGVTVAGAGDDAASAGTWVASLGACADEGADAGLIADWSGVDEGACAKLIRLQAKRERTNPELERTIRIRTFWEICFTPTGKLCVQRPSSLKVGHLSARA